MIFSSVESIILSSQTEDLGLRPQVSLLLHLLINLKHYPRFRRGENGFHFLSKFNTSKKIINACNHCFNIVYTSQLIH